MPLKIVATIKEPGYRVDFVMANGSTGEVVARVCGASGLYLVSHSGNTAGLDKMKEGRDHVSRSFAKIMDHPEAARSDYWIGNWVKG